MDLISTLDGSLMDGFLPRGWDLRRIDDLCSIPPDRLLDRQPWWHDRFTPVGCRSLEDFDVALGHEIALTIRRDREAGRPSALILPVGPMGMYRWAVRFLAEWEVACDHVHGFNMDEWSDRDGFTLPPDDPGAFQSAMEGAFYGPLADRGIGVPADQRHFATRDGLPDYPAQIEALQQAGAELTLIYGIGRVCHIAFWEPHFAADYPDHEAWRLATHRLGARLHPLTVEQNALTSFKGRITRVPAFANTIGPGIFLQADRAIGGADGVFGRGMQWQGPSLRMTLRYGPDPWIPSSYVPTLPGRLFYLEELAGSLEAEVN